MEKITDANTIGNDVFNAGNEDRESDRMPDRYADEGENWRRPRMVRGCEFRQEVDYYLADAKSPDATGQDQWRQDEAVDLDMVTTVSREERGPRGQS